MTNITPVLSSILIESHSADPLPEHYHSRKKLNAFLQEAYRINTQLSSLVTYLRDIRQPYLSTAPPPRRRPSVSHNHHGANPPLYLTDASRVEIDASTSLLLRDLDTTIQELRVTEDLRTSTETTLLERKYGKPNTFLWRWAKADDDEAPSEAQKSPEQRADEGRAETLKTVRASVIWYLQVELAQAMERRQEMVEIKAEREREKERSVLWKMNANNNNNAPAHKRGGRGSVNGSAETEDRGRRYDPANGSSGYDPAAVESQLSPEQLQLFESENSTLLNYYNDTLKQVTQAEKSVLEIASLQQTLISHLSTQGEMIGQLVDDAQNTDENVRKGNKELKKASERGSTAKMVFWSTLGICGFLVTWDLVF